MIVLPLFLAALWGAAHAAPVPLQSSILLPRDYPELSAYQSVLTRRTTEGEGPQPPQKKEGPPTVDSPAPELASNVDIVPSALKDRSKALFVGNRRSKLPRSRLPRSKLPSELPSDKGPSQENVAGPSSGITPDMTPQQVVATVKDTLEKLNKLIDETKGLTDKHIQMGQTALESLHNVISNGTRQASAEGNGKGLWEPVERQFKKVQSRFNAAQAPGEVLARPVEPTGAKGKRRKK